mgnify:FL=1
MQHDSTVAVCEDGNITCAISEERLNRIKNYWGCPERSLGIALRAIPSHATNLSVSISNLFTGQPYKNLAELEQQNTTKLIEIGSLCGITQILFGTKPGMNLMRWVFSKIHGFHCYLPKMQEVFKRYNFTGSQELVDHHTAHIYSTVYSSGFNECLAISLDMAGDGVSARICSFKNGLLEYLDYHPLYHSVALPYFYITHILGFTPQRHEGKITGLAAYGDGKEVLALLKRRYHYDKKKARMCNRGYYMGREVGVLKKMLSGYSREDISAGVQMHLEWVVTSLVDYWIKKTGHTNVAVAGGVFANVTLNQKINEHKRIKEIWIFPNMGDGGLSVGCSYYSWVHDNMNNGRLLMPKKLNNVYLGPEYSDKEIEEVLVEYNVEYTYYEDVERKVAEYLVEGKVVARFNCKMEFGPRALGNRSILYKADDVTVNQWLNKNLGRSEFMPFAPVLTEESAPKYLKIWPKSAYAAEFMTLCYEVTEKMKNDAPASVHIDNTVRPQVVVRKNNPSLYKILTEYEKITGVPILINTSFNMHEEPIVCTPGDALRAFIDGDLDIVVLGKYVVCKNKGVHC